MIEPIMFFGIGFLAASLFGLVLIPLVHNRAVRLTMRRLEAATPLSMAEIQADKDQLRAEFAMSTRRLELSVEQMKTKATGQLAELGKKSDAINRLKVELGEKTAAIFSLEARERTLKDQLGATEAEHTFKIAALRDSERMLADKRAELAKVSADLGERTADADSQRVEASALRVQVDTLKERVTLHEREAQEITTRLAKEREDTAAATADLNQARNKVDKLTERVAELERALVAQTTEAEVLSRRISELETRVAEQSKLLSSRDTEISRLKETAAAASKTEADLRGELATAVNRGRA
jgi:chromosome segregation ATPase